MEKVVYTLKKKKGTEELHLFEARPTDDNKSCTPNIKSICKEMSKEEISGDNVFACQSEDDARMKCAKIGKQVCGDCVSHLYKTKK